MPRPFEKKGEEKGPGTYSQRMCQLMFTGIYLHSMPHDACIITKIAQVYLMVRVKFVSICGR